MSRILLKSIANIEHDGWMTKQGGSFKSWKRRWFVLKGSILYYFKNNTPDTEVQGQIDLTSHSFVKPEHKHGKKRAFAVATQKRIFFMYADSDDESVKWIKMISSAIERLKSPITPVSETTTQLQLVSTIDSTAPFANEMRNRLTQAREYVGFLKPAQEDETNKVLEFWHIWFESIPPEDFPNGEGATIDSPVLVTSFDLSQHEPGSSFGYELVTSSDMQKLTWRTFGPQSRFIQKMVDFFWNVGAPESEIDRLNDVGALINPPIIGSWVDMSNKDGMDGGWYFPSETPLKYALDAADAGSPSREVAEWAASHQIVSCISVGRDMGAAPPRQTEIRFSINMPTLDEQLQVISSALETFGFPAFSEQVIKFIENAGPHLSHLPASSTIESLTLAVVITHNSFVRIGVIMSNITPQMVEQLCTMVPDASLENIMGLAQALSLPGPLSAEFQYLNPGFGYNVYKEGFDIHFHFSLGNQPISREPVPKLSPQANTVSGSPGVNDQDPLPLPPAEGDIRGPSVPDFLGNTSVRPSSSNALLDQPSS